MANKAKEYKIEKGISMPHRSGYPFADMDIGDSFYDPDKKLLIKIRNAAYNWGRNNERKFNVSVYDTGVRCWRIA